MRCRQLAALLLSTFPAGFQVQKKGAAPPPTRVEPEQIDAALAKGVAFLRASSEERLPLGQLMNERVGQSALSLYTLLKCGVSRDDDVVRRLLAHVMLQQTRQTYDAACALLAASAYDAIANRRWISALARQLLDWRTERGDWSYPAGDGDLSNTQYAALGLWAASRAGVQIEAQAWAQLATAVLDYQALDGGFRYTIPFPTSGSMTAAGCGVLAICECELRRSQHWDDPLAGKITGARARGLAWLAANFSVTRNPPDCGRLFYYLYGLERLGALAGVARIGEHDWYEEGAAFLVEAQGPDGAWNHGDPSDTCFALLFLERATSAGRKRAPITGSDEDKEPACALRLAVEGDGPTRAWIDGWDRRVVGALEWPGERGRGPRVEWVEYMEDERTVALELGDATRAAEGGRFAIEHVFSGVGKHRLRARAVVLAPGSPPREQVLESRSIELDVARAWPRWIDEERVEMGPDLLVGVKLKARVSSEAGPLSNPLGLAFPPEFAFDGEVQSPWLADPADERRELALTLERSVNADVIRIAPAVFLPLGYSYLARPIEIEVEINGKDEHRLAMAPDPSRAMRIELERPVAVKRLDVRILSVVKSPASSLVGIAEIELFRRGN